MQIHSNLNDILVKNIIMYRMLVHLTDILNG